MRVLFDGHWWVNGPFSNQQVARAFVLHWAQEFEGDAVTVAVPRDAVETARAELPEPVAIRPTVVRPQALSAMVELPVLAARVGADVVVAHNFAPLWGFSAVFVHDFMFMTNPEWFTPKERAYFRLMPLTKGRANLVLTSSRTEAARVDRFGKTRTSAAPIGLGLPRDLSAIEPEPVSRLAELRDFVLVVGRLDVRKNLQNALEAAVSSRSVTRERPVVVVGERSAKGTSFSESVAAAEREGRVVFTGFVTDAQLAWLYRVASLFLFLSFDEGFGLPCVEAMTFGVPAVVSDIPVFREVMRDYPTYVDPRRVGDIAEALDATLASAGERKPEQVIPYEYTWPAVVRAMRGAIARALGSEASDAVTAARHQTSPGEHGPETR